MSDEIIDLDKISEFWANYHTMIFAIGKKIIASLIVIVAGVFLTKGLKKIIKKSSFGKLHVDDTVSSVSRYIVTYGIFIICVIMILNIIGVNTASLIAVLGAAGIAVGLALKDTLGNIASGIVLFLLGSYKIGEFIEFNSYNGTVKEMNLFTTVLETPDGIYISAPNSSIWGNPLKNYTRNGKRRMEIPVRVSCSDSIDTVFNVLNELIGAETMLLKEPAPQIIVLSTQDSFVNLAVRAWAENQNYWNVYWKYTRLIREKIEEAGITVPFPRQNIHIIQADKTI